MNLYILVSWVCGIFFLFWGLTLLAPSPMGGLSMIAASLLFLPNVRSFVFSKQDRKFFDKPTTLAIFSLLVMAFIFIELSDKARLDNLKIARERETMVREQVTVDYFRVNSGKILGEIRSLMAKREYQSAISLSSLYANSGNQEILALAAESKKQMQFEPRRLQLEKISETVKAEGASQELILRSCESVMPFDENDQLILGDLCDEAFVQAANEAMLAGNPDRAENFVSRAYRAGVRPTKLADNEQKILFARLKEQDQGPGPGPDDAERWKVKEKGVLLDTLSGLQWTQRDNSRNINWNGAKAYCKALSLAGGGWRLPTLEELKQVYMYPAGDGTPCGSWDGENITCQVSSLFHLTSGWFWSSDQGTYASEAWAYDLGFGTPFSVLASSPGGNRALCVRQAGVLTDQEEPRDLANSEDARKLRGQLCIYLRQLIEFKDEENFRKFGFGIGGPYNKWLKNVEALGASYPKGLNHPTLPFELRVATGELLMLGHKYVQRDSEYTDGMLPEIKKTIDFRNCR